MRVNFGSLAIAAAIGIAVSGLASPARAAVVTYTTTGTFSGGDAPGTNTYVDAARGINIVFNGITENSVNVPPASTASFGSFDTHLTTATSLQPVSSDFTLLIAQTSPVPGGPLTFVGSLSGQLTINSSQAFIQFSAPLSQSIGETVYKILSADSGTPGRLDLVPPSTNLGVATLQGQITTAGAAVPEPSALTLLGLGTVGALLFRHRSKKATAAA